MNAASADSPEQPPTVHEGDLLAAQAAVHRWYRSRAASTHLTSLGLGDLAQIIAATIGERRQLERDLLAMELDAVRSSARALADSLEGDLGLARLVLEQMGGEA